MMMKVLSRKTILPAVMMFTLATSVIFMSALINKLEADADRSRELKVFEEAITVVRLKYVEDVQPRELINGAIKGMMGSLDPRSDFAASDKYEEIAGAKGILMRRLMGAAEADVDNHEGLRLFEEALATVRKNYAADGTANIRSRDLVYSAIQGMVGSLDPHSEFMTPEQYKEMRVDAKGEFGGIGVKLDIRGEMLTVVDLIDGTPAFRAGIKEGDRIAKINDKSTENMTLQEAIDETRGMPSTMVKLTIFRAGWKETKDLVIRREQIRIDSVESATLGGRIGYIKIRQFQEQTASEFSAALSGLVQEGVKSLILDLRNNPGGLLHSAVDVASQFIPSGKLVVYTQNRSGKKKEYRSGKNALYTSIPLVVLVDKGSASASEILTGALKDWHRAAIVGTATYGKGSVQTVVPLEDGSALRITTARYYTPRGTSIQSTGITPDVVVKSALGEKKGPGAMIIEQKEDIQLQKAMNLLRTGTSGNCSSAHSRNELQAPSTSLL
ncbi:MAG: S41 family peptidase [Nitrospirota bacterium]